MSRFLCEECSKSYSHKRGLKRHWKIKHAPIGGGKVSKIPLSTSEKVEEVSFIIKFNPHFAAVLFAVHSLPSFGSESQKFLLERRLSQCKWDGITKIEAKFQYITPQIEKKFKVIEEVNLRSQGGDWYKENIIVPIWKEMIKIEDEGNIVVNLCHIKGFTNKPLKDGNGSKMNISR